MNVPATVLFSGSVNGTHKLCVERGEHTNKQAGKSESKIMSHHHAVKEAVCEVAQWVKCLLPKHEELNLISKTY